MKKMQKKPIKTTELVRPNFLKTHHQCEHRNPQKKRQLEKVKLIITEKEAQCALIKHSL